MYDVTRTGLGRCARTLVDEGIESFLQAIMIQRARLIWVDERVLRGWRASPNPIANHARMARHSLMAPPRCVQHLDPSDLFQVVASTNRALVADFASRPPTVQLACACNYAQALFGPMQRRRCWSLPSLTEGFQRLLRKAVATWSMRVISEWSRINRRARNRTLPH